MVRTGIRYTAMAELHPTQLYRTIIDRVQIGRCMNICIYIYTHGYFEKERENVYYITAPLLRPTYLHHHLQLTAIS